MRYLTSFHKNGGWLLLQNIHLTIDWTSGELEKKVDKLADGAHPEFRLFLSAEPPPLLERALPISILQVRGSYTLDGMTYCRLLYYEGIFILANTSLQVLTVVKTFGDRGAWVNCTVRRRCSSILMRYYAAQVRS